MTTTRSGAGRESQGPFRLSQLAVHATVLAQRVGRRFLEGQSIGLVAQLLQVAHQCFQSVYVVSVGIQHPPRARVQERGVDRRASAV